jgi:hypothetical protein
MRCSPRKKFTKFRITKVFEPAHEALFAAKIQIFSSQLKNTFCLKTAENYICHFQFQKEI